MRLYQDDKPRFEAGSVRSPIKQAILAAVLAAPQGLTLAALGAALAGRFDAEAGDVEKLRQHLHHLADAGHVHRRPVDQVSTWFAGPVHERAPEDKADVVPPRRVSMFGAPYEPKPVAMRPGAMDYASKPSLHMGQRRAFRSDAAKGSTP